MRDSLTPFIVPHSEASKFRLPTKEEAEAFGLTEEVKAKPRRSPETSPGLTSLPEAEEIMGADFLGPDQIKQSLGVELKNIPPIPFSKQELERFKAEGFELVLRAHQDSEGHPLTMKRLNEIFTPKFASSSKGQVLYKVDWYPAESFYTSDTPSFGWRLQQKELLPDSTNKNYLQQTELILSYLKTKTFTDSTKEQARQEAIQEAEQLLPQISQLDIEQDWQTVAQSLSSLKINQFYRRSPVEVIYDHTLRLDTQNSRLFNGRVLYDWTKSRSSDGDLVYAGNGDAEGVRVSGWWPLSRYENLGVALSV